MTIVHARAGQRLFEFLKWRSGEIGRDRMVQALGGLSAAHLASGAPRYFGTFAHDGNSHLTNVYGRPERDAFDLIFDFLEKRGLIRGTALDIGANLGAISLFLAQHYSRVFSFEPHPITFSLLEHNIRHYGPNISAHRCALYDEASEMELEIAESGNIGGFALTKASSGRQSYTVETTPLDQLDWIKDQDIGLMKVDVEGAEPQVFRGARTTIKRCNPIIIFEDFQSRRGKPSLAVQELQQLGYQLFLEPVLLPRRRDGGGMRKILNLISIALHGNQFALVKTDYQSPRGYDILVALHQSHQVKDALAQFEA